jgi:hypothetical protein
MPFYMTTISGLDNVLPPWWSKARDREMTRVWKDVTLLSVMMFAAQTKIANLPIRVVAKDTNIVSHAKMAEELTEQFHTLSQYGEGLQEMMVSVAEDYFGTDNGAFMEVVAPGKKSDPIEGIPIGLRHLDSLQVDRMSDPLFPIRYRTSESENEVFHHSRVIAMSQMRSARRNVNGVGFCAISRSVELAQKYQDLINYIRGKMGGRAFKRLLVGKNITGRELIKAIAASTAIQQEIGGMDVDSIAVGGTDIEVDSIDLANFSEFDEEQATFNTMALMALAWGLEFNEVFPMPGSKASEEVALQRSRGRLPSFFVSHFSKLATAKLVPPYLRVEIDFVDDFLDQQREIIADIRSRNLQRLVEAGILTTREAREVLHRDRYITDVSRLTMALAEGMLVDDTPAIRVFMDPAYDEILLINREYLLGEADPAVVERDAQANILYIYGLIPTTNSQAKQEQFRIALKALDGLLAIYRKPPTTEVVPVEPPVEEEAPAEPVEGGEEAPEEDEGEVPAEKMRVTKATVAQNEFAKRFREDLLVALTRPGGPSQEELEDKMENAFKVAAFLALGTESIEEEDQAVIDRELAFVASGAAVIITRALNGTDMGPTADRLVAQIRRVYWDILLHSEKMEGNYTWVLGETDHCETCLEMAGYGEQPASFWKEKAGQGIYPQSQALACTGFHCQCHIS